MLLTLRPYATAGIAVVGASVIVVTPLPAASRDVQTSAVQLTTTEVPIVDSPNHLAGLIYGGSGMPLPQVWPGYDSGMDQYIQKILPGADTVPVATGAGSYPIFTTPTVFQLQLDTSVPQTTTQMHNDIVSNVAAGNTVVVSAYSQSTSAAGAVMPQLEQDGVPADQVKFLLTGDVNNPDGGFEERIGAAFPYFGATFAGSTPSDTPYDTYIYSQEYDGFANFPKYPLNILSVLNAWLGGAAVHYTYHLLTPTQIDDAIQLPTSTGYDGDTTYYMIPSSDGVYTDLPLLFPLRAIPVIGNPLADLLQPDLTQLVNLGYDNPANEGWDAGPANITTPFGLGPSTEQVMTAIQNLGPGTQAGITAFVHDISNLLSNPSELLASFTPWIPVPIPTDLFSSPQDFINTVSSAFNDLTAELLPLWDNFMTQSVTIPTNMMQTVVDNLDNPLNAMVLAADQGITQSTFWDFASAVSAIEALESALNKVGVDIPFLDNF